MPPPIADCGLSENPQSAIGGILLRLGIRECILLFETPGPRLRRRSSRADRGRSQALSSDAGVRHTRKLSRSPPATSNRPSLAPLPTGNVARVIACLTGGAP